MRWIAILVCSAALAGYVSPVQVQAKAAAPRANSPATAAPKALLPGSFAGWVAAEAPKNLTDPTQADGSNAAVLKEYEFTDAALASYKRGGETLTLRVLRFFDASGAYGAYSFYRQSGWTREQIGAGAASNQNRMLFWLGNTLVDANFSRIGPKSGSELRALAGKLPVPDGNRSMTPPVLAFLPKTSLDHQTTRYAVGPASYTSSGGVLPPSLVSFNSGAEALTANYSLRSGSATLTIVNYPTPQMAIAQEALIRKYIKSGSQAQPPFPKPLASSNLASLEVLRSGPLVAVVSGAALPDESHKLLAAVHFEADVASIPIPPESEVAKTGKLLLGIAQLILIGSGAAIFLGFFLGGGRALYRMARGRPISSVYEEEFISLHLLDLEEDLPPEFKRPHPKG